MRNLKSLENLIGRYTEGKAVVIEDVPNFCNFLSITVENQEVGQVLVDNNDNIVNVGLKVNGNLVNEKVAEDPELESYTGINIYE